MGNIRVPVPGAGPALCHYRQTEQTAPMCEIDDLSHSQEARWKDRNALFEELIIYNLFN